MRSHSPVNEPKIFNVTEYVANLHAAENKVLQCSKQGRDLADTFSEYFSGNISDQMFDIHLLPANIFIHHSLARLANVPEIRNVMINVVQFLDPFVAQVAQAEMLAVLGGYVSTDQEVRQAFQQIAAGGGFGVIALNSFAVSKAQEILARMEGGPRRIHTQEQDIRVYIKQ